MQAATVPKILLVTWTPPGDRNVGEIILRDLCSFLPRDSVRVCEVSSFSDAGCEYERLRLSAPSEKAWYPFSGRFGGLCNHLRVRTIFKRAADRLVQDIVQYAQREGVDRIWLTLSSQALIRVGAQLGRVTKLPVFSIVWDPADFLASHQGWDSHSVRWTMRNFHRAMASSTAAMVVSEPMVERYSRDYGIDCTVVRHAFAEPGRQASSADAVPGEIRIGFAGTLYDQGQLNCLLSALNRLGWTVGGRSVRLRMVGNFYRFTQLKVPANVELLGWRSTEETRDLLAECDFAYLPVSFQPSHAEFARLAFPTKLSTYLAAGIPVLVHAPGYAAPVPLVKEHGFGVACESMSEESLASAVMEIADPASVLARRASVQQTCISLFTRQVMRRQFARFLSLDEELLNA